MLVGHVLEAVLNGDLSALIPPGLSSMIDGAKDAINEELNKLNPAKEFMNDLENWAKTSSKTGCLTPQNWNVSRRTSTAS